MAKINTEWQPIRLPHGVLNEWWNYCSQYLFDIGYIYLINFVRSILMTKIDVAIICAFYIFIMSCCGLIEWGIL